MKSLVLTLALPEKDLLPETEYRAFFARKKPPHLAGVVLMTSNRFFLGGLHRFDPIELTNLDGSTAHNYRSTILIGHAVIQVFGARVQTRTPVLPNIRKAEFASRIWPPLNEGVHWPLPSMEPDVVEKLLDFFFDKRVG